MVFTVSASSILSKTSLLVFMKRNIICRSNPKESFAPHAKIMIYIEQWDKNTNLNTYIKFNEALKNQHWILKSLSLVIY